MINLVSLGRKTIVDRAYQISANINALKAAQILSRGTTGAMKSNRATAFTNTTGTPAFRIVFTSNNTESGVDNLAPMASLAFDATSELASVFVKWVGYIESISANQITWVVESNAHHSGAKATITAEVSSFVGGSITITPFDKEQA